MHRITRALTTGAYRRRSIPLERDSIDKEEHDDEAHLSPRSARAGQALFRSADRRQRKRSAGTLAENNVRACAASEDPFTYEALVVPSLEDALIAVLFNHNIQAIVVRPGLVLKSKTTMKSCTVFSAERAADSDEIDAHAARKSMGRSCAA